MIIMAIATYFTGAVLYQDCVSVDPVDRLSCINMVLGVHDGFSVLQRHNLECYYLIPSGVTSKRVVDTVVEYAKAHPDQRSNSAALVIISALRESFPCAKQPR